MVYLPVLSHPLRHTVGMRTNQLVLLSDDRTSDFLIDTPTREAGRRGIAAAREALRLAAERQIGERHAA